MRLPGSAVCCCITLAISSRETNVKRERYLAMSVSEVRRRN